MKPTFTGNHGGTIPTKLFFEISRGTYDGITSGSILSFNPDVDLVTEETIWAQGGIYTYLTADTELFMSSTSVSDTGVTVLIEGLTQDYVQKSSVVSFTNGQSQQTIGTWFRIHDITVIAGGAEPLGDLYVAQTGALTLGIPDVASEIKAKITQGVNTTQLGLYTVPANHTFYVVRLNTFTRKNKDAVVQVLVRPEGFPAFIRTTQFPTYQSEVSVLLDPPFVVTQKTDLELRAVTTTNQTEVVANVGYILIDDSKDN